MKFSTREDIEAPLSTVYEAVTDFDGFERQLLRRGVDIAHDESCPPPNLGAVWQATAKWRNRAYDVDAELISIDPDNGYAVESRVGGVECLAVVDLVPLSKSRTRLLVSAELKPTTLSSRLLIQSLKLTKGSLTKRFKKRVFDFAQSIEA
ncbi:MAG: SRPBCC family protein [Boseongicola sp.]|nr:SRPBCC family protein [Boseongicola sp.]MDD9979530.1 SRPBCC family protein [Boseongicola sp.]